MFDEELKKLYMTSQKEYEQLALLQNGAEKKHLQMIIFEHDAQRRELVAELIPPLSSSAKRSAKDYFFAAAIYSRGKTAQDDAKAYGYARKAYDMVQFMQDDFSSEVKALYSDLSKKLKIDPVTKQNTSEYSTAHHNTPFEIKPGFQKKKSEKEMEEERLKATKTCMQCGRQHSGPCPPK